MASGEGPGPEGPDLALWWYLSGRVELQPLLAWLGATLVRSQAPPSAPAAAGAPRGPSSRLVPKFVALTPRIAACAPTQQPVRTGGRWEPRNPFPAELGAKPVDLVFAALNMVRREATPVLVIADAAGRRIRRRRVQRTGPGAEEAASNAASPSSAVPDSPRSSTTESSSYSVHGPPPAALRYGHAPRSALGRAFLASGGMLLPTAANERGARPCGAVSSLAALVEEAADPREPPLPIRAAAHLPGGGSPSAAATAAAAAALARLGEGEEEEAESECGEDIAPCVSKASAFAAPDPLAATPAPAARQGPNLPPQRERGASDPVPAPDMAAAVAGAETACRVRARLADLVAACILHAWAPAPTIELLLLARMLALPAGVASRKAAAPTGLALRCASVTTAAAAGGVPALTSALRVASPLRAGACGLFAHGAGSSAFAARTLAAASPAIVARGDAFLRTVLAAMRRGAAEAAAVAAGAAERAGRQQLVRLLSQRAGTGRTPGGRGGGEHADCAWHAGLAVEAAAAHCDLQHAAAAVAEARRAFLAHRTDPRRALSVPGAASASEALAPFAPGLPGARWPAAPAPSSSASAGDATAGGGPSLDATLPFHSVRDSARHFRSPAQARLFSNRQRVQDLLVGLVLDSRDLANTWSASTPRLRSPGAPEALAPAAARAGVAAEEALLRWGAGELMDLLLPGNYLWFASFFVDTLLRLALQPSADVAGGALTERGRRGGKGSSPSAAGAARPSTARAALLAQRLEGHLAPTGGASLRRQQSLEQLRQGSDAPGPAAAPSAEGGAATAATTTAASPAASSGSAQRTGPAVSGQAAGGGAPRWSDVASASRIIAPTPVDRAAAGPAAPAWVKGGDGARSSTGGGRNSSRIQLLDRRLGARAAVGFGGSAHPQAAPTEGASGAWAAGAPPRAPGPHPSGAPATDAGDSRVERGVASGRGPTLTTRTVVKGRARRVAPTRADGSPPSKGGGGAAAFASANATQPVSTWAVPPLPPQVTSAATKHLAQMLTGVARTFARLLLLVPSPPLHSMVEGALAHRATQELAPGPAHTVACEYGRRVARLRLLGRVQGLLASWPTVVADEEAGHERSVALAEEEEQVGRRADAGGTGVLCALLPTLSRGLRQGSLALALPWVASVLEGAFPARRTAVAGPRTSVRLALLALVLRWARSSLLAPACAPPLSASGAGEDDPVAPSSGHDEGTPAQRRPRLRRRRTASEGSVGGDDGVELVSPPRGRGAQRAAEALGSSAPELVPFAGQAASASLAAAMSPLHTALRAHLLDVAQAALEALGEAVVAEVACAEPAVPAALGRGADDVPWESRPAAPSSSPTTATAASARRTAEAVVAAAAAAARRERVRREEGGSQSAAQVVDSCVHDALTELRARGLSPAGVEADARAAGEVVGRLAQRARAEEAGGGRRCSALDDVFELPPESVARGASAAVADAREALRQALEARAVAAAAEDDYGDGGGDGVDGGTVCESYAEDAGVLAGLTGWTPPRVEPTRETSAPPPTQPRPDSGLLASPPGARLARGDSVTGRTGADETTAAPSPTHPPRPVACAAVASPAPSSTLDASAGAAAAPGTVLAHLEEGIAAAEAVTEAVAGGTLPRGGWTPQRAVVLAQSSDGLGQDRCARVDGAPQPDFGWSVALVAAWYEEEEGASSGASTPEAGPGTTVPLPLRRLTQRWLTCDAPAASLPPALAEDARSLLASAAWRGAERYRAVLDAIALQGMRCALDGARAWGAEAGAEAAAGPEGGAVLAMEREDVEEAGAAGRSTQGAAAVAVDGEEGRDGEEAGEGGGEGADALTPLRSVPGTLQRLPTPPSRPRSAKAAASAALDSVDWERMGRTFGAARVEQLRLLCGRAACEAARRAETRARWDALERCGGAVRALLSGAEAQQVSALLAGLCAERGAAMAAEEAREPAAAAAAAHVVREAKRAWKSQQR